MPITPDEYTYPFDHTGQALTNKIEGEIHVITQQNHRDFNFIIPKFAPFFGDSVRIIVTDTQGTPIPFVEGTHYYLGHHFLAASRAIGKQVYGSISIIDRGISGVMSIGYQTIGGKWTFDEAYLNQLMTNIVSNPRVSSWDSIVELPGLFPVIDHEWDLIDMVGMQELINSLFGIEEAVRNPGSDVSGSQLANHLLNYENPHKVSKTQVGLGNVENLKIATVTEAEEGNINTAYMTPDRVKRAIIAIAIAALTLHKDDKANPHEVTAEQLGLPSSTEFNNLLLNKLDKTEAAANAYLLDGLSFDEISELILAGTVANAIKFDGKTYSEVVDDITNTDVRNALRLGNMTVAQLTESVLGGKSFTSGTADLALNSNKLEGKTKAEVIAEAIAANPIPGTIDNANKLDNQLPAYYAKQSDLDTANQYIVDLSNRVTALEENLETLMTELTALHNSLNP